MDKTKAILILDMPQNCYECNLNNYHFCDVTSDPIDYDRRPNGCPLIPMPSKRDDEGKWTMCGYIEDKYTEGYNDCIDEILRKVY